MCQQYGVMDDMFKLLAGLESAEQFLNEPCPAKPGEKDFFGDGVGPGVRLCSYSRKY